jgi:ATP-binding cassette subfamily B (MDR/TAP) protein 1
MASSNGMTETNGGSSATSATSTTVTTVEKKDTTTNKLQDEKQEPMEFEKETQETGERGFFAIYNFATRKELALVCIGVIAALGNGSIQPIQAILLGHIWGGNAGRDSQVLEDNIHENVKYMLLLGIVSFICNYLQFACFMMTSEKIIQRMKRACLNSLLRQEIGFFDANPSGLLSARINEQSILVQRGIAESLGSGIQFTSQFISGFVVSFTNNYKVATAMLLCMPAIVILLSGLIFAVVHFVKKTTAAYEEAGAVAEEALKGIQTIASFNGELKSVRRYDTFLATAEKIGSTMWIVRAIGMGLIFSSIFFNIGIGYWWGSVLISRGGEDFGGVLTSVMSALVRYPNVTLPQNYVSLN